MSARAEITSSRCTESPAGEQLVTIARMGLAPRFIDLEVAERRDHGQLCRWMAMAKRFSAMAKRFSAMAKRFLDAAIKLWFSPSRDLECIYSASLIRRSMAQKRNVAHPRS